MNVVDSNKRLWVLLGACVMLGFLILGFFGREIYRQAPPIPERIVTADGTLLATRDDILTGQQVWQSAGGQQLGSVWGHGAYQAPDWTADWLHREATGLLDMWSVNDSGAPYAARGPMDQAVLRQRLMAEMRTNTFDSATGTLTVSSERANVLGSVAAHYEGLFGGAPGLSQLREAYAMQDTIVPDPGRREKLTWFFFWTSWAAATERPGARITYTNNWPHEPLVGNEPSSANILWSIISVVLLLAAVGASFSALEVLPLVLIGLEAFRTSRLQNAAGWMAAYRWPSRFFVGVSFWNFVGAGIFGFLINPPISLYYMQGLNTTPVHAHSALFGVYGLLSLGLMLVVARKLSADRRWKENLLAIAFWGMNVGLGLMIALSLLPIGLTQTWASIETGLWYARSADFLQLPWIEMLRWMRIVGDVTFAVGVAAFALFMIGLITGWSYERRHAPVLQPVPAK